MLHPLKLYQTRNEIFQDLDLKEDVMQGLTDIFEDYGKFEYDEEAKHVFIHPKPKNSITHRIEETHRGINFIIWTYTMKG